MNIKTAQTTLSRALQHAAAGKHLDAARRFYSAVREARQCRAKARDQVQHAAAVGGFLAIRHILSASSDPAERSEAGRIRSELGALYPDPNKKAPG